MNFYAGASPILALGQIMVGALFIIMLFKNIKVWDFNVKRVGELLPMPKVVLVTGFIIQTIGGLLVIFDYRADVGAIMLIVFSLAATAMFHRFWTMDDPLRRNYHMLLFSSNIALFGALLMIYALAA
jgi:uncharacterized membrane protein YphA (DoxX/SURF4 family)